MNAKQIIDSLENKACPLYFYGTIDSFNQLLANSLIRIHYDYEGVVSPIVKLVPSNNPIVYGAVSSGRPHWCVYTSQTIAYQMILNRLISHPEEDFEIVGYAPENES